MCLDITLTMKAKEIKNPSKSKTAGSRRIFSPTFKIQVLDSYRKDSDCQGNQRATARKYGIHRRQIQKWLQMEMNLRRTVELGKTIPSKCSSHHSDANELLRNLKTVSDYQSIVNVDVISDSEQETSSSDEVLDLTCPSRRRSNRISLVKSSAVSKIYSQYEDRVQHLPIPTDFNSGKCDEDLIYSEESIDLSYKHELKESEVLVKEKYISDEQESALCLVKTMDMDSEEQHHQLFHPPSVSLNYISYECSLCINQSSNCVPISRLAAPPEFNVTPKYSYPCVIRDPYFDFPVQCSFRECEPCKYARSLMYPFEGRYTQIPIPYGYNLSYK